MEVRHRLENKNQDESEISSESDNENINTESKITIESNWKKDRWSISLLLFLYLLQGIPLGMAGSIPLIIQQYGASWSQQATFSFAFWPFSLKLLWAPIVDALYIKRFGRRKTWLIPTQYLIGACMVILSFYINDLLLTTKTATNNQPRMINSIEILI